MQSNKDIKQLLEDLPKKEVYSTIGVYSNEDRRENAVASKDLEAHIKYNLEKRPGRAFFVEGRCINPGYLSKERILELEGEFKRNPRNPLFSKPLYT